MNKVKVEANKDGNLISVSKNNPLWGWIRVTQTRTIIKEGTDVMTVTTFSALVQGWTEDLNKLGWKDGMELDGKIIFKDSLTPFNKRNPERDYKVAGKSGIVCSKENKPIYRKYFYSPSSTAQDTYLAHDNEDDIKTGYAAKRAEEDNKVENKEFSL